MNKLICVLLSVCCLFFAKASETKVYCINENGDWYWLNSGFAIIKFEKNELLLPKPTITVSGIWKSKFVYDEDKVKILHYFVLNDGIEKLKLLKEKCKELLGEDFYPQPAYMN